MSWPLSQDYNEAIQSPASNFSDPDLKRGEAVCNALGLPAPYSGNFADVYQVRCPDGSRWAVKCFTREAAGLHERYQEISAHLKQAKLPFMVDFSYRDRGIRVAGKWYPVLKMQWVEGLTLNQFVAQYLDKPAMLEALLQVWVRTTRYLRAADVAHCDLQHGNILLVPGATPKSLSLKLIDYDGMWVPALAGKPSGEVGHPSYQHPQRLREGTYSLDVDRFPVLLIATAMRAVKARKSLWERYDNGDNLLFKEPDLRDPVHSEVFQELASLPDAGLVMLAAHVRAALRGGLESAALLEEAMPDVRPAPAPAKAPRPAAAAGPASGIQPAVLRALPVAPPVPTAAPVSGYPLAFDDGPAPAPSSLVRKKKRKTKGKPEDAALRLPMVAWNVAIRLPLAGWIGVGVGFAIMAMVVGGLAVWAFGKRSDAPIPPQPDSRLVQKDAGGSITPDNNPVAPKDGRANAPINPIQPPPMVNPPPPAGKPLANDDWLRAVAAMPVEQQVTAVADELKRRNPGFDGKVKPVVEKRVVVWLELSSDEVTDISPVRALTGLRTLRCDGMGAEARFADLSPLRGLPLTVLNFNQTAVSDLSPLKGMPLTYLSCYNTSVSDLSPLTGMPLDYLNVSGTKASDLSPLKGMPLTYLVFYNSKVSDLSPLKGMPLKALYCADTPVSDLSPLKGMKLGYLACDKSKVSDLAPLKGMPLDNLNCSDTQVSDLSPLKGMPLTDFSCSNTQVSDLSLLKDMKLKRLFCNGTAISNLSPLKGMPLYSLNCAGTQVSDLSPLKGMPLTFLGCDFKPERDAVIVRSISTLQNINEKPAKDFWNEVDAKQPEKKP